MRHPFSLPLLALSLAAFATPTCLAGTLNTQAQAVTLSDNSTCPVELSAEHHGLSELVPAGGNLPSHPLNETRGHQAFDLSIKNTHLQRIVAAELEVHGTSSKSRIMPATGAVLTTEPAADAVRNVHLASSVPADQSRTNTVSVKNLTSISWINVIELRYADGSTWHAHPGSECRVIPNGMMLIAGK
jgi:hypothetical protein